MSEGTEEINELKRKAKELGEQASDFEFGFETPSKIKPIDEAKQVFAVHGTNNPLRRSSVFIETSNLEPTEKTNAAKEKKSHPNVINVPSLAHKQNPVAQNVTSNVFDGSSSSQIIQTNEAAGKNTDDNVVEFQLNAENDDDLLLQNSMVDIGGITESLLFRNNYFQVTSQQGNGVSAMCVNCGVDENNQPIKVLKSQKNISSNFIDHLKVKMKISILIFVSDYSPSNFIQFIAQT